MQDMLLKVQQRGSESEWRGRDPLSGAAPHQITLISQEPDRRPLRAREHLPCRPEFRRRYAASRSFAPKSGDPEFARDGGQIEADPKHVSSKMPLPSIKIYPDKFVGQVALITGAAQGIGQVTARLFAAQGATVVLVDIQEDKLQRVADEIAAQKNGKADVRVCNIGDENQVNALVEGVISEFGQIDITVHL